MEKVDGENGVICLVYMFPYWVKVVKLSNKVRFFVILCWPQQKSKYFKTIYVHASESSYYTLSENGMIYMGLRHLLWDISNQNIKKVADSAEI